MRGWCADTGGVAELPMQLMIGACILAFAAPIFYSAYGDLSENITSGRMEGEIDRMIEVMEQVLSGDAGSRMTIEISLEGTGSCNLEEFMIGGEPGSSRRYIISYSLSSGYQRKFSLDPPFPITGPKEEGLKLGTGDHKLTIENVEDDDRGGYLLVSLN